MSEVIIADGRFKQVPDGKARKIVFDGHSVLDASELTVIPGFIDIHCHGAEGIDVNRTDAAGFLEIGRFLSRHGVTGWLPTLVPDSQSSYEKAVSAIDKAMDMQRDIPVAQILGVHYEGVFANEHMCGALHKEHFRAFSGPEQLDSLPLPKGGVRMMTFAPEIEGGIKLAQALADQGWIASIGHTKAEPHLLDAACDSGAKHVTHFFNAMTGIHHRDLGVAGWALLKTGITFDIIADGIHVHPKMLRLAVDSKTPSGVTLISDSIAPTGLGDGDFEVWGESISVSGDSTSNSRGCIAGSVITMFDAVRMMCSLGYSDSEVSQMASANPARLLGLEQERGTIDTGKRADFVLVDTDMTVTATYVGGEEVC